MNGGLFANGPPGRANEVDSRGQRLCPVGAMESLPSLKGSKGEKRVEADVDLVLRTQVA